MHRKAEREERRATAPRRKATASTTRPSTTSTASKRGERGKNRKQGGERGAEERRRPAMVVDSYLVAVDCFIAAFCLKKAQKEKGRLKSGLYLLQHALLYLKLA